MQTLGTMTETSLPSRMSRIRKLGWISFGTFPFLPAVVSAQTGAKVNTPRAPPRTDQPKIARHPPLPRRSTLSSKQRRVSWTCGSRAKARLPGSRKISSRTIPKPFPPMPIRPSAQPSLNLRGRRNPAYEGLHLSPDVARKFSLLKLSVDLPAPRDPAAQAELAKIAVSLDGDYGKGAWCQQSGSGPKNATSKENCLELPDIERIFAISHDPKELLDAWKGWHAIAPPMRTRYIRMVELGNEGARDLGFADVGAMWRSNYDMPPDEFARELDRLWEQVRPLYVSLHAYVRWKLAERYGKDVVREDQPIPAHLLGDMWAQEWTSLFPLLTPGNNSPDEEVTAALHAKNIDAKAMVHYGEAFYMSLGFEPLPASFLGALALHQAARS